MQIHARAVIVGGGMMGCSLLYHLAEEGAVRPIKIGQQSVAVRSFQAVLSV